MLLRCLQGDAGQNPGRYSCNLTLTLYPQQQVLLSPKDLAELSRQDMVQLWKVLPSLLLCTSFSLPVNFFPGY